MSEAISKSKVNWTGAVMWLMLVPAPFLFFILVNVVANKAPGMAAAYSLVPYATLVLAAGFGIKGRSRWRSWRGVVGLPFAVLGGCGLAAILANGIMYGL
ncbi:hypothetical protein N1937_02050 [Rhizobium sp. WSM4643]|uniref:hypothetical protein n=1 Tax=Rhizobium sp. WSM4643 TaxID=3138253 RepID=UPI0021A79022|nr:hypothetical protein [Rhizobium leguminosarum]UWM76055.1 hypothetical protein N1937_02050 [Rhizobium leguminosarum bv. viciae]